mmetsp:Transcript_38680/g.91645  ORF Transcript_38680/g.91645 Transcript_38680/m.91645 type:complete len:122 (-) Transcript_38680:175-540(-)
MHAHTVAAAIARRRVEASERSRARNDGQLAPEDEEFISGIISKYDKNSDGGLQEGEIAQLMTDLNEGIPVPLATVKKYAAKYDRNHNGQIDKKEVRKLVAAWYVAVENAKGQEHSTCCCIC